MFQFHKRVTDLDVPSDFVYHGRMMVWGPTSHVVNLLRPCRACAILLILYAGVVSKKKLVAICGEKFRPRGSRLPEVVV